MEKITPFLWFEHQAEEAANFYVSVFPNWKIERVVRWTEGGPGPAGSVLTVEFELNGQRFTALNGGPQFKFTEAVSFVILCEDQEEIDRYWDVLTANGGQESMCGWLKDKYGLSWQVTPTRVIELLKDPAKGPKAMEAVLQMRKLDIAKIEAAAGL